MNNLTRRQSAMLKFIKKYREKHGYPPSLREVGAGVGLSSPSSVYRQIKALEEGGFIKRDPLKPRAIDLMDSLDSDDKKNPEIKEPEPSESSEYKTNIIESVISCEEMIKCPVIKGYSPGVPLFSSENVEKTILLTMEIAGKKDAFLLKMMNDSMVEAGILKGDICIIHPAAELKNGEIAAVVSNDALTVKRVYKSLNSYRLQPENRRMNPVFVKDLVFLGHVAGIIRLPSVQ